MVAGLMLGGCGQVMDGAGTAPANVVTNTVLDGPADWQRYAWADDQLPEIGCLSVTVGEDAQTVMRALQVDPATRMAAPEGSEPDQRLIAIWQDGPRVITFEDWICSADPETRHGAVFSQKGSHTVLSWSDEDDYFVHLVAGKQVRGFEPLLYDVEGALPEERGLPFPSETTPPDGPFHHMSAALTLLERLTGARFDSPAALAGAGAPVWFCRAATKDDLAADEDERRMLADNGQEPVLPPRPCD